MHLPEVDFRWVWAMPQADLETVRRQGCGNPADGMEWLCEQPVQGLEIEHRVPRQALLPD